MSNKNKIAIIHNLPSGGALRMLTEIINRYSSKCEIDIFSISTKKPTVINNTNLLWYKVKPWKGFIPYNIWIIFKLSKIHKSIAKKINWTKYDLVFVTHDYFTKSPYILRNIKTKNILYLCQEAQREYYESSKYHAPNIKDKIVKILRLPIKLIDERNVRFASHIICNSRFSKKILEKIYKKKCEIVYPGVDNNIFNPGKGIKKNMILCVGGINKIKGQDFIIESLRPLLRKYSLVLIGNGRSVDVKAIEKLADNLNIKISNNVDDIELKKYYQDSKVTCIAAYNEPFGLTSVESQSCSTPVVSVNQGGPKETIINGKTGYLSSRNKNEYLEKVKKAIENHKEMGNNGVKNVQKKWLWEYTLRPLDKYFLK